MAIDSSAPSDLRIRLTTRQETPRVGDIWTDLEQRAGSTGIACSWAWTHAWLQHYGTSVDHCFAIGEADGAVAGIALVTGSRPMPRPAPWLPFRGMVHIGTAGEPRGQSVDVEYNRLLALPEHRAAFARQLVETVRREARPFAIRLDGFLPDDIDAMAASGLAFERTDRPCPTFDLQLARQEGKDVLAMLGSGVRSRIRRSDRGFGNLESQWTATESEALDIYEEMIALHQARWQREGRPGAFASDRFTGFHREFIRQSLGEQPKVMLYRLRSGETTIGCLYGFIEDGMLLFYQSGFVDTEDNRLKPGLSTHAACMQECLERGLLAYNFLAGEARYKRELATTEHLIQSAIAWRFPQTRQALDTIERLGLVERARSVKRWRERRAVAAQTGEGTTGA